MKRAAQVTFRTFPNRAAEIAALVESVRRDIAEGLSPSRQLLVVIPGLEWEPCNLQRDVFRALRQAGIGACLPGNRDANVEKQRWPHNDPNGFWRDGDGPVSPVMQAKGNEADVVCVLGLDHVAAREDRIGLRNQLFVGISRSRGWVHLSGRQLPENTLYREVEDVLESGNSLLFMDRPPRRQLEGEED